MQTATEQPPQTDKPQPDLYRKLSDNVAGHLEAGHTPWQKSPAEKERLPAPVHAVSGKAYTGINTFLLCCAGLQHRYTSHEWAGFNQWKEREESIRKGEKGTLLVYYDTGDRAESGEAGKTTLKSYVVFNRCQLSSYREETPVSPLRPLTDRLAGAQAIAAHTGAEIVHKGKKAFYDPTADQVHLPSQGSFKSSAGCTGAEKYYGALFRELVHWTGHPQRLNRTFERLGTDAAVAEELIAAFGAFFLCTELDLAVVPDKTPANITAWLEAMKRNKYLITTAATAAWKAVGYLHAQPVVP